MAHHQLEDALYYVASRHATGRLLDIGCGLKPYRALFAPFVSAHIGVDHAESVHDVTDVEVLAGAYDIPLQSDSFDTVLLTEVLEHLERPAVALTEATRLLRPGGKVILTTPFIWVLHEEPRDFFRYTPYGLRFLLEDAGLTEVTVYPVAGQWSTLALLFGYALRPYRRGPVRLLIDSVVTSLHNLAPRLDRLHFKPSSSYNHVAVAKKPLSGLPDQVPA